MKKPLFCLLFLACLLIVVGITFQRRSDKSKKVDNVAQNFVVREYTEDQLERFWQNQLEPTGESLANGKYPITEINAHHAELSRLIKARYGNAAQLQVVAGYHKVHPLITATHHVTNGVPYINFALASFHNLYDTLRAQNDPYADERIKNGFVVSMLHEMEHLAYGYTFNPIVVDADTLKKIEPEINNIEKRTWAITCESVVRPFLEHRQHVMWGDLSFYDKWAKCGRDVNSLAWEQAINESYSLTRRTNSWKDIRIKK